MEPIKIVCWKWKDPKWPHAYTSEHVNIFADSIRRNTMLPHKVFCITDDPAGIDKGVGIIKLWPDFQDMSWCFTRLRAFSEEMINLLGERFFSIDLDTVFTGNLDEIFLTKYDFVAAKDTQPGNCYNGSFWGMKSGAKKAVWEDFKANVHGYIAACRNLGFHADDQSMMAVIMGRNEKTFGAEEGLYSFKNEVMKNGKGRLPKNAKLVFFHGNPKPEEFKDQTSVSAKWINENYRRNKKGLLILGGASCVWDDLKTVDVSLFDIMVVNDIGYCYKGNIDYWVTLHPEKFSSWETKRAGNKNFEFWSYCNNPSRQPDGILREHWKAKSGLSGSSGMFAAQVGVHLGYDHVLLAGVPMDSTNNQTGPKDCWNETIADNYWQAWVENADKMRGKVFSCSGRTKKLLGFEAFNL